MILGSNATVVTEYSRSAAFDALTSEDEVRDHAVALIERLNGALALSEGTRQVAFGGVARIEPNGIVHRTMIAEGAAYCIRGGKARAVVTAIGPDGKPIVSPPSPSEAQRWSLLAERDELLDDALIYFGRADDWFDIYKCIECLEGRAGGEKALRACQWISGNKFDLLRRSANAARHARRNRTPNHHPIQ